jgi:ATP-binding protein involved in chromosome partitioning
MVTDQQVLDALRDVEDPEVHKSIVELDMVRNIAVDASHVSLEVVLTIRGCPLRTKIEKDVEEKLLSLPGIETVEVRIGHMTDEERGQFTRKLRGQPDNQAVKPSILDADKNILFLAIASGKGGVGKSTVTANLARSLTRLGLRVGIIDADIYGFSIPGIFGVKATKPTVIDDLIIPIEVEGIKLISMHFFVPDNSPVVWRGPMLGKMLRNFFGEVHWGEVDVILLDLPPGTGDIALDVHTLLPKSKELIVTTPQTSASDVAVRAGIMGLRTNHEIVGVVENMAYYECPGCQERAYLFGQGGGKRVAEELKAEVLAQIPLANMDLHPRALFEADTVQGKVYDDLARLVAEKTGLRIAVR